MDLLKSLRENVTARARNAGYKALLRELERIRDDPYAIPARKIDLFNSGIIIDLELLERKALEIVIENTRETLKKGERND